MKYSVCVESVFESISIYDRLELVKEFHPEAVEFWDISRYDVKRLGKELSRLNLPVSDCCLNHNWDIRTNAPFEVVKNNVLESIRAGKEIGCSSFICMSGDVTGKTDNQKLILTENLKRLAEICEKENITLLLEALNTIYDHKGYYLDTAYDAFEIVEAVGSPAVKVLFDCYHMQIMQGNLVNTIRDHVEAIGHVHSAGVPGRHELQLGEINYPLIIKTLKQCGYDGYFGLEYFPSYDDKQSLQDVFAYIRGQEE